MSYGKNMKLYTSNWNDKETFKMFPTTEGCPFAEVIYDSTRMLLVVISKFKKQNLQLVPKLNEDGNPVKSSGPKKNGKFYKEERLLLDIAQEYYIEDVKEQEEFLKEYAVNVDFFDYGKFLRSVDKEARSIISPEVAPLVDAKGMAIKQKSK